MDDLWFYALAGFLAQCVDGSLGMGFGVSCNSLLLTRGLTPGMASAAVHAAECLTTGVSGLSHRHFGNIDKGLFWRLAPFGVIGAIMGAYILSQIPGSVIKPYIAAYLLAMGVLILWRSWRASKPKVVRSHLRPLAVLGAFVDMIGGGGWGPIVTSTLIARGNDSRTTIGTVNAAEFFITLAGSITFLLTMGMAHWQISAAIAGGGLIAAPFGAWVCKHAPRRPLLAAVGALVIFMAARAFWQVFA